MMDSDRSGYFSSFELRTALASLGKKKPIVCVFFFAEYSTMLHASAAHLMYHANRCGVVLIVIYRLMHVQSQ